jgi:hypothetical protein
MKVKAFASGNSVEEHEKFRLLASGVVYLCDVGCSGISIQRHQQSRWLASSKYAV